MSDGAAPTLADAIRSAVRRGRDGSAGAVTEAVLSVPAGRLAELFHDSFAAPSDRAADRVVLTTGLAASPGAASGAVVLSAEAAVEAAATGRAVILVRPETTPDDVLGMQAARGVLTSRGGLASHAAVVARGWGIPAVVGAAGVHVDAGVVRIGDVVLPEGAEISIDGRTGEVFAGALATRAAAAPDELEVLLDWADRIRAGAAHPVAVRANADTAADAAHAHHLGAQGIGLCRTEHMFLADDRLALMRRFILSADPAVQDEALAELAAVQQHDFEGILVAMAGHPITIRLLDPPLHEFLPDVEALLTAEARGELDATGRAELAAVRRLREVNPMIGTRGVRLGVVRPGLYEMQVRALCRAMAAVDAGHEVQVMIPLVVDPREMRLAREWVAEATCGSVAMRVGAMIETPRAAALAGALAEVSDFFSFGTNDLTQLTFAFSRDDVGAALVPAYVRAGLLDADPFEVLDRDGVGSLIRQACAAARERRPGIELGVCGEHAGDPASAAFLVGCGVDYVSCSPYRVPIARLAVAQALLAAGGVDPAVLASIAAEPSGSIDAVDAGRVDDDTDSAPLVGADEFAVLHALRIKGFAPADAVAELAATGPDAAATVLTALADAGLVRHIPARDLWQLSPAGRDRHAELLTTVPPASVDRLRTHYDAFVALNVVFKDLCTAWQTRDGEVNDHQDAIYDTARVAELAELHRHVEPVLAGFADAIDRFASYPQRLAAALARATTGETRMFTGVMCGSYHDVWMELHEDLIQLLGVDRHAEGSF